ncbi:signal peptidase II [Nocardioides sp. AE5]|uniref:signal peptidase II n=1 Tax=Nocardioides sp. AE5 TaxID=2962573 RepID=UPI002882CE2F|nr:signal peptidase II [Nocardioides sp. AE5]MDT0201267.1 signal peptidase II [Nocardioides sp. AE5]
MQAARRAPLNSGESDEPAHDVEDETTADDAPEQPPARRTPYLLLFALIAALGLGLDQWTKHWAENSLEGRGTVEVVGRWLGWHLTYNSGASFSMGTSYTEVLSVIAIGAVLVVLFIARRLASTTWAVALGVLLAGIGGNLTDRIFRAPGVLEGHVVDFIRLPNWPIFNIADICITVAAALIIIQTIRGIRVDGLRHES